jgi:hypothetical protein
MIENVIQFFILTLSSLSIWFMAGKRYQIFGFIIGLCGQPLWIYTTYKSGQWGMLLLSLWFIFNHIRGIVNYRNMAR